MYLFGATISISLNFQDNCQTLLPMHPLNRYSNGPAHLHCSRRTGHFDLDHSRGASPRVGVANRVNKAVSSVTLRQSYRLTRKTAEHLADIWTASDGNHGDHFMHLHRLSLLRHHPLLLVACHLRDTYRTHQLWITWLKLGHLILFAPWQPTRIRAR